MPTRPRSRPWVLVAGVIAVLGIVLAACGGGSSGSGGSDGTTDAQTTSDVTIAATGAPQTGGTLNYALEAESDGFNPTTNRWAISGLMVANAVFDPLAAYDADGKAQPYLAKAFTPSADFKTWTIELRPGITFTNGQPLDGAAVKKFIDGVRASALVGGAAANINGTSVDPANPLNVIVTMTDPWASFPASLTGQAGMVPAPAQLDAAGDAASRQPIGTGPFMQKEWVPDNRWVGTKNPNYWRKDASGVQLPYLDSVVFKPVVDTQNRSNALISGDVQMMHTTDWASIDQLKNAASDGKVQLVLDPTESEETFFILNTSKAPLDDVRVRRALALCTDTSQIRLVSQVPDGYAATSQFKEDSPWYSDSGFPAYDPSAGTDLINQVKAEKGDVTINLGTTPVPSNTAITQTAAQQWEQCGVKVNLVTTEQSKFILDMATGNYQVNLSRQFGESDPDQSYVWWTGKNATGGLALNFARLDDAQINAALDKARASDDPAVRKQAYADLVKRQSELVPYIWINHTQWAIGAANNVRNLTNVSLPDGKPALPFQSGNERLTETWLQN
jgi:peptide/nickel transport system substrate-binding protein